MKQSYKLKKGSYIICDPAVLIKKNDDGEEFLQKLWKIFYKHPNEFQHLKIKGVKFLISRTEGGDGVFNGLGTDTGVFMILDVKEIEDHDLFNSMEHIIKHAKKLSYDHDTEVYVENFNIYFEGFEIITE